MDEFELIRCYFAPLSPAQPDVVLGIGDDAALLAPAAGHQLAVTSDTLIAGRHFPVDTAPFDIGWKALAVNLSDLAAMGARARWFTLALTLPDVDRPWLAGFAAGLKALAADADVALVGGDTTRGPLSVTITAIGEVPAGRALRRSGAQPGDRIAVSGTLGDAAAALRQWQRGDAVVDEGQRRLRARLDRPSPRLALGLALRDLAHAAIDLSDGLAADLGHVLDASGVGAAIRAAQLPTSAELLIAEPDADARQRLQLAGGDDYELCLTVPASRWIAAQQAAATLGLSLTDIGEIVQTRGFSVYDGNGAPLRFTDAGYRHFP